jgi:hypothetical protein
LRRRIERAEPRLQSRRRVRLPVRRQSLSEHSVFLTRCDHDSTRRRHGHASVGMKRYSAALRSCCKIRPGTLPTAARRNHDLGSEPTLAGRPKPTAVPREVTRHGYPHEHEPRSGPALRAAVAPRQSRDSAGGCQSSRAYANSGFCALLRPPCIRQRRGSRASGPLAAKRLLRRVASASEAGCGLTKGSVRLGNAPAAFRS